MQDRYLFRGKRVDNLNKDWVIGHYVRVPRPMIVLDELQPNGSWYWFEVDPSTIGQCTGLLAAKSYRGESDADRLVFEGDIVKCTWDDGNESCVGKVEYISDEAMFAYCVKSDELGLSHFSNPDYNAEIIGNIHDRAEGGI